MKSALLLLTLFPTFFLVSNKPVCSEPSVLCPGSAVCLNPIQLCDGKDDCPNGFDEKLCIKICPLKGKRCDAALVLIVDMRLVYYLFLGEPPNCMQMPYCS